MLTRPIDTRITRRFVHQLNCLVELRLDAIGLAAIEHLFGLAQQLLGIVHRDFAFGSRSQQLSVTTRQIGNAERALEVFDFSAASLGISPPLIGGLSGLRGTKKKP
jgi:hypothetical protein